MTTHYFKRGPYVSYPYKNDGIPWIKYVHWEDLAYVTGADQRRRGPDGFCLCEIELTEVRLNAGRFLRLEDPFVSDCTWIDPEVSAPFLEPEMPSRFFDWVGDNVEQRWTFRLRPYRHPTQKWMTYAAIPLFESERDAVAAKLRFSE